jgi:peroxiredoxin Q/BCP
MNIGDIIKNFATHTHDKKPLTQADFKKGSFVFYFYPKDDTPGCTQEACDFRDHMTPLKNMGIQVVGISKDNPEKHIKFIEKYQLPFTLLSDESGEVCEAFNVFKEKSMFGKTFLGVERSTFYIVDGIIQQIWRKVSVKTHVQDVVRFISQQNNSTS